MLEDRHPLSERGADLYETPAAAVRALLSAHRFAGPIWEPACGRGAIVRELTAAGYDVVASDLHNYRVPRQHVCDFLNKRVPPDGARTIITNPPFSLADEFVRQAVKLCPNVVMLL